MRKPLLCMLLAVTYGVLASAHAATDIGTARPVSAATIELSSRILQAGDNANLPFAIVDKQSASVSIYRGDGTLAGVSTVLLGLTPGDEAVPGVGLRTQTGQLRTADLTTPAGRFVSQPGRNLTGEAVVWVDYDKALAIHRLRAGPSREKRALRMASSDPRDKRISAGCVVVPEAFYDGVVQPVLGGGKAVVYIMPERGALPGIGDSVALRFDY